MSFYIYLFYEYHMFTSVCNFTSITVLLATGARVLPQYQQPRSEDKRSSFVHENESSGMKQMCAAASLFEQPMTR